MQRALVVMQRGHGDHRKAAGPPSLAFGSRTPAEAIAATSKRTIKPTHDAPSYAQPPAARCPDFGDEHDALECLYL